MRAGSCSVPQTLTAEAASVLKHSLSLARRRGHAQVTPLHVAATLLSSRTSLLRRACLRSQPQNLQCRALDLCFNVALNRLPTTTTSPPLIHSTAAAVSLSNALRAALKRAQAHQRRGTIEQNHNQQAPLLAIKVEMEQLVMSILDDPSVSRVMREAGFSSAAVKSSLEEDYSVFQCFGSSSCNTGGVFSSPCSPSLSDRAFRDTHFFSFPSEHFFNSTLLKYREDSRVVLDVMLRRKRKNVVIVGHSTEGVVAGVMAMLEAKHILPEELRFAEVVKFQFSPASLKFMRREEVEACLSDLRRRVDSNGGGGSIIFLGDLKWTCCDESGERLVFHYSPVDHLVSEIGRLVSETKIWLLATASYKAYMSCQMRRPPLEIQWTLQPVSVLSGGLGLTLHSPSIHDSRIFPENTLLPLLKAKHAISKEEEDKLVCCEECSSKFEREAELLNPTHPKSMPSFLQPLITAPHQKDALHELKSKWNKICCSLHSGRSFPLFKNHNSLYPLCSNTHNTAFHDSNSKAHPYLMISLDSLRSTNTNTNTNTTGDKEMKITLALGNSQFISESENWTKKVERIEKYRLTIEENIPWQSEIIPLIVEALMENERREKETWLLIEGNDTIGKRRLARAIAESIFSSLLCLDMSKREDAYSEILAHALRTHMELVVLVENADLADDHFMKVLVDIFKSGKSGDSSLKEGSCCRAIFIVTTGDDPTNKTLLSSVVPMMLKINDSTPSTTTSSGADHKRKAEWDVWRKKKTKSPRPAEKIENMKLDLNTRAEEEEESSPISSDLTTRDRPRFLDWIINRYIFDWDPLKDGGTLRDVFLSKLEEIALVLNIDCFGVEETVLEELVLGCGSFPNSLFDEWVKGVFETSLKVVKIGGRSDGGIRGGAVRLCLGGKEGVLDSGFMGSCLPTQIQTYLY